MCNRRLLLLLQFKNKQNGEKAYAYAWAPTEFMKVKGLGFKILAHFLNETNASTECI